MDDATAQDSVEFELNLRIGSGGVQVAVAVPNRPLRVADLLPALYALQDAIGRGARDDLEERGKPVSCKAGCAACCRQLVAISESEAIHLAEVVAKLPEERRAAIRERFARTLARLDEHDLLPRLRALPGGGDAATRLGLDYFALALPCPFLESESCSLYEDRPMRCREYAVTSPAENCSSPSADGIEPVPLPARPAKALYRFEDGEGTHEARALPIVLALEFAESVRDEPRPCFPGPALFKKFLASLSGG